MIYWYIIFAALIALYGIFRRIISKPWKELLSKPWRFEGQGINKCQLSIGTPSAGIVPVMPLIRWCRGIQEARQKIWKKSLYLHISCLRTPNSWASYFSGHPASCCVQRPSGKQKLSKIWQTCPGWHPVVGLVPTSSRFPAAIASKRAIHTSSWTKHVNLWNIYENNCASNNATSHFFA